jgi:uncharacterized protein
MQVVTQPLSDELAAKSEHLGAILRSLPAAAVAFSGGVDSSFLLAACIDALGAERVIAYTVTSPLLPERELSTARQVAAAVGATHRTIAFDDLAIPEVAGNVARRCYYCKRARFQALQFLCAQAGPGWALVHGENVDDAQDYRPGSAAAAELGVRAPLAEAGLTKVDIRALSRERGLATWDHPAAACLATRFPQGTTLTREGLRRVEAAENYIRDRGIRQVRVRDHFPVARLEVAPEEIVAMVGPVLRTTIVAGLRALGYRHIAVDLEGYRMGSMNEQLDASR